MESKEKSLKEIKVDRVELEIEIRDTQYLIDTNTNVAQEMTQEHMMQLQQLLKENKKTTTAVKLGFKNEIRNLKLDIVSPPNENNPKYYKEDWLALVQMSEEKI